MNGYSKKSVGIFIAIFLVFTISFASTFFWVRSEFSLEKTQKRLFTFFSNNLPDHEVFLGEGNFTATSKLSYSFETVIIKPKKNENIKEFILKNVEVKIPLLAIFGGKKVGISAEKFIINVGDFKQLRKDIMNSKISNQGREFILPELVIKNKINLFLSEIIVNEKGKNGDRLLLEFPKITFKDISMDHATAFEIALRLKMAEEASLPVDMIVLGEFSLKDFIAGNYHQYKAHIIWTESNNFLIKVLNEMKVQMNPKGTDGNSSIGTLSTGSSSPITGESSLSIGQDDVTFSDIKMAGHEFFLPETIEKILLRFWSTSPKKNFNLTGTVSYDFDSEKFLPTLNINGDDGTWGLVVKLNNNGQYLFEFQSEQPDANLKLSFLSDKIGPEDKAISSVNVKITQPQLDLCQQSQFNYWEERLLDFAELAKQLKEKSLNLRLEVDKAVCLGTPSSLKFSLNISPDLISVNDCILARGKGTSKCELTFVPSQNVMGMKLTYQDVPPMIVINDVQYEQLVVDGGRANGMMTLEKNSGKTQISGDVTFSSFQLSWLNFKEVYQQYVKTLVSTVPEVSFNSSIKTARLIFKVNETEKKVDLDIVDVNSRKKSVQVTPKDEGMGIKIFMPSLSSQKMAKVKKFSGEPNLSFSMKKTDATLEIEDRTTNDQNSN